VSRLTWAKAKPTLAGLFAELPEQWPTRLAPVHLARLQAPSIGNDWRLTHAFDEAISAACTAGEVAHEMAAFVFPPLVAGFHLEDPQAQMRAKWQAQCTTKRLPAVAAGDFASWLGSQGETPSEHVAAWLEATGGAAKPAPPTAAPAPAIADRPAAASRWTPDRLEELRAYREAHGTTKAAEWAGVSPARVRALLPGDKPQPKGYSAFSPRLK